MEQEQRMCNNDAAAAHEGPDEAPRESLDTVFWNALGEVIAAEGKTPSPEQLEKIPEEVNSDLIARFATSIAEQVLATAPATLQGNRAERTRFEGVIRSAWGGALDLLDLVVQVFYEFGRGYILDALRDGSADRRTEALGRLHARAVRTANEVLRLLESGLADGALARCRSLHELAVVALVLSKHGPEISERYLLHEAYHLRRIMRSLQEHAAALGWDPPADEELEAIDARVVELETRFGEPYTKQEYGWAAGVIAKKKGALGFRDLEKAVNLEKFRPFFSWASDSVHAGPHGLRSLGMPPCLGDQLYAGGSTSGLADPGQHAAISIAHFTGALSAHCTTLEAVVGARTVLLIGDRCQAEFIAANVAVEEQTRANASQEAREQSHGSARDACA
jgi:hypothetical protein